MNAVLFAFTERGKATARRIAGELREWGFICALCCYNIRGGYEGCSI